MSSAYRAVYAIHVKQSLAQPVRVVANVVTSAIRLVFLFAIYSYVYTHVTTTPYPFEAALASAAMYNVLLSMSLRKVFDVINSDIKSGAFETSLLRPMHYLYSVAFAKLGTMSVQTTITCAVIVPLFFLFSHTAPHMTVAGAVWGVSLVVGGTILSGALYSIIALPALWINDAEPFYYIVDKSILIFGGSYVPVALFPQWLKVISEYSPFGGAMFGTRMFDPHFLEYAPRLFLTQAVWIAVLMLCAALIFRWAMRHVSINGG